ncbi:MAG: GTPase Era [Firmicutes bacterium]|nr:GTPase Era [Bacillota bacterium]
MKDKNFKTGFVAVLGLPNAGKSTLMNSLVGEKVSIVTHKPQTTRDRILGILNQTIAEKSDKGEEVLWDTQIIFIDTPGIIDGKNLLDSYMIRNIHSAREDADVFLVVVDAKKGITGRVRKLLNELDTRNKRTLESIQRASKHKISEDTLPSSLVACPSQKAVPIIVVMNKMDIVEEDFMYEQLSILNEMSFVTSVVSISAMKSKNTKLLLNQIVKHLPKTKLKAGEKYYPENVLTDKSFRFMVGEIIREKLFTLLQAEIPFGVGIEIEKFEKDGGLYNIHAVIYCERDTHKGIIIGKGGAMLKKVGQAARFEIELLLESKVYLQLFVKVREDWRDNRNILKDLGYS